MPGTTEQIWTVVKNAEGQYSIWWADRSLPDGWVTAGFSGTKQACLENIDRTWTDMRPASLIAVMNGAAQ